MEEPKQSTNGLSEEIAAPTSNTPKGLQWRVKAVPHGASRIIASELIDQTVPMGNASPCSRKTYLGQVKCMC